MFGANWYLRITHWDKTGWQSKKLLPSTLRGDRGSGCPDRDHIFSHSPVTWITTWETEMLGPKVQVDRHNACWKAGLAERKL